MNTIKIEPGRRGLTRYGGLIAFDVGVGKTFTAIAVIARARQEGQYRKPVILVPAVMSTRWREQEEASE